MTSNPLDLMALVSLAVFAVFMPLWGIWDFQRLRRWVAAGRADARTRTYYWIMAFEWVVTIGFVSWWLSDGRTLASMGLAPAAEGWQWLAIGLGLAVAAYLIWQTVTVVGDDQQLREARGKFEHLKDLVPRTARELRLFDMVAATAGICEEILYRGVLLVAITPAFGLWPAVALSSVIFGLGHAYQGFGGIVKTGLVGLVFALLTVFSGSLFVPILLHIVLDLASGRTMRAALQVSPTKPTPQEA